MRSVVLALSLVQTVIANAIIYDIEGVVSFQQGTPNAAPEDLVVQIMVDDNANPVDTGDLRRPVETGNEVVYHYASVSIAIPRHDFLWSSNLGKIRLSDDIVRCSVSAGNMCLSPNHFDDAIEITVNDVGTDLYLGIQGSSHDLFSEPRLPQQLNSTLIEKIDVRLELWDDPENSPGSRIALIEGGELFLSTGAIRGDFNGNGVLDEEDISELSLQIRNGSDDFRFDMVRDGIINKFDSNFWVYEIADTFFGDANLDGEFNTQDLVQVFSFNQYDDLEVLNSTWGTGDWNGDGEFNSRDLILAFQDGGFERGPRVAIRNVPEPNVEAILISLAAVVPVVRRVCRFM